MQAAIDDQQGLYQAWAQFTKENPKVRIRDAAKQLGVSEAQLVATRCGETSTRLRNDYDGIFSELESFGELLAITRNDTVVHETRGEYLSMRKRGNVAMFFKPGLDTRFFFDNWSSVFAVNENERFSIQFFDRHGQAAHKIYMTEHTDLARYNRLVEKFRANDQYAQLMIDPIPSKSLPAYLDGERLRADWAAIKNVHQASTIIRSSGCGDHQSVYRELGIDYACPLKPASIENLLQTFAERQLEIMIFAMGQYAVQSYGGKITETLYTGPWFNILDEKFNLHLRYDDIDAVWLIRKPSDDGWITSLDVFDKEGRELMVICANRSRGYPEREEWTKTLLKVASSFHLTTLD